MRELILYLFLMVITNPYEGLSYNQINSYDINYCYGQYCPDQIIVYDYLDEEEEEEEEEELYEEDEENKPLIFPIDFSYKEK